MFAFLFFFKKGKYMKKKKPKLTTNSFTEKNFIMGKRQSCGKNTVKSTSNWKNVDLQLVFTTIQ